jgi:HTH-type transcriptional regulator, sugar sensing transcriptional regulator
MNEEILTDIGLSQNEAKVYLCLLNLGLSSITQIADNCKLHRANVYDSMKKLINKGLAAYLQKDNVTLYEASNPQSLLRIVKEKEIKIRNILPQLMLSKKFSEKKGEAHVYEGVNAFVRILYGFLEHNEPILIYGIPKLAPNLMKTKIPHFHTERIKLKLPMKHIYNHDAKSRIKYLNKLPYSEAKYLPSSFDSQVSTNICGDTVVLTLWSNTVISIQIKNKDLADSYKQYFKLLWDNAKFY